MRHALAAFVTILVASSAGAATQQQCEALSKPVESTMAEMEKFGDSKPTPQACARAKEAISAYASYQAKADKLNCPFAYVSGQKIGGAEERAGLMDDMKKAYSDSCR